MSSHVNVINTYLARTIGFTSMQRNTLMCVTREAAVTAVAPGLLMAAERPASKRGAGRSS